MHDTRILIIKKGRTTGLVGKVDVTTVAAPLDAPKIEECGRGNDEEEEGPKEGKRRRRKRAARVILSFANDIRASTSLLKFDFDRQTWREATGRPSQIRSGQVRSGQPSPKRNFFL